MKTKHVTITLTENEATWLGWYATLVRTPSLDNTKIRGQVRNAIKRAGTKTLEQATLHGIPRHVKLK
jgi:hypothetical protein